MNQLELFNKEKSDVHLDHGSENSAKLISSVCLFSSAGIGELGIKAAGIEILVANEKLQNRVELYRNNFKDSEIISGDIWEKTSNIIEFAKSKLNMEELFLIYATPPCQGMSSNGMGRLKMEVAEGRRSNEDERNRLIIPTMDVITNLRPKWVLLENVPAMRNTEIRLQNGESENIVSYISRRLGPDYVGGCEVVACQDYGIPQRRRRLITIFTNDPNGKKYFSNNGGSFFSSMMKEPVRTLRDAIGHLPELDSRVGRNEAKNFHPLHYVPVMDPTKYWWVSQTIEGNTAFNNQCVNPDCEYSQTPGHKDVLVNGKWIASKETPIDCISCGSPLPRPTVLERDGTRRPMKGFHSAYRRMLWDEPARTLTQNFIYEASDNKIHPEQNRVLSIYEATIVQTIDRYSYQFQVGGKDIGAARIAEVIGESVPPYLIEKICNMMKSVTYSDQLT